MTGKAGLYGINATNQVPIMTKNLFPTFFPVAAALGTVANAAVVSYLQALHIMYDIMTCTGHHITTHDGWMRYVNSVCNSTLRPCW